MTSLSPQTLIVATRNPHKISEIRDILEPLGYRVQSAAEAGYDREIEETGSTFAENAALKASSVSRSLGLAVLADDSGLEVDALQGAPGVLSARYAGVEADDAANNRLLLENLGNLSEEKRSARFHCSMVLTRPDGSIHASVSGTHEGVVLREARGSSGFGYDPLFYSPELGKTFAEATPEEKNRLSHRSRALQSLSSQLSSRVLPFSDRLTHTLSRTKSPILLGLDPHPELLPSPFANGGASSLLDWGKAVIGVAKNLVPAIKIQMAHYECWGGAGLDACIETALFAQEQGLLVIADGKRGDIGATARSYAQHLEWADALTVHPYLGTDSMTPFIDRCRNSGSGLFVLVRTSNPSASEIQDCLTESGSPVYETAAGLVKRWGSDLIGKSGYSSIGAVAGATQPEHLARIRSLLPQSPLLVPGYGAQGGSARDVLPAFDSSGGGALIAASRSLTFAYKSDHSSTSDSGWELALESAIRSMSEDLACILSSKKSS
ncbi:MAG: XTP/dITP diphosphatase [Planctomycetota bacterium]|nr:XTP/dITP diphosphatase [Planctomycetota bacterium]